MDTFKCIGCKNLNKITDKDIKKDGNIYSKCLKCREKCKVYSKINSDILYEKTKEWRDKNKDTTKINNAIYYEENKQKLIEKSKAYYDKNREQIAEYKRIWRLRKLANTAPLPTDFK